MYIKLYTLAMCCNCILGNLPSRSSFIPEGKHPSVGAVFQPKAQTKSHPPGRRDLLEGEEREREARMPGRWLGKAKGAGDKWEEIP